MTATAVETAARIDTRDRVPWSTHVVVFLAPAAIVYTIFSIYPLADTIYLSLYATDGSGQQSFVGFGNFITLLTDPRWAGTVLERLQQQPHLLRRPHDRAELDRARAGGAPQPAGADRAQRLPDADLPADDAVGGDHRLHLAAHPVAAVGCLRRADSPRSGWASWFAPWLGLEGTALVTVSLISVWQFVGIPMMLIYAALLNIPDDLVDAATVDGANQWHVFW